MKMSVSSGRGGGGNHHDHFLEEGVFDRVMEYERAKIMAYKNEQAAKRRTRTYSNAKSTKSSSDDGASQIGISFRRSWASKSAADVSSQLLPSSPPKGEVRDSRKSLRATLLAPLRTTFTRQSRTESVLRDDTSSFSACSLGDHAPALPIGSPVSPVSPLAQRIHSPSSPTTHLSPSYVDVSSPLTDDTHSALLMTPSTAEMFGELGAVAIAARKPMARRQSTGMHRSPRSTNKRLTGPPPMPSPTEPLPPLPIGGVLINGRSSLPPLPRHPPPSPPIAVSIHTHFSNREGHSEPTVAPLKSKMVLNLPMKTLHANPAPMVKPILIPTSYAPYPSSTASSSQERLKASDTQYHRLASVSSPPSSTPPIILTEHDGGVEAIAFATVEFEENSDTNGAGSSSSSSISTRANSRARNRRLYNTSFGARSASHLPVPGMFAAREASFYDDGSDVDRVDPFIAEYGRHKNNAGESRLEVKRSFESWLDAPPLTKSASSLSNISIPSLNESQPELVAA
ncbi:hypothetical protein FRC18_009991 [Serendipita sp. 400]|nr:hypothetical protein FRC18_009991 [Serendipita sp. 400]